MPRAQQNQREGDAEKRHIIMELPPGIESDDELRKKAIDVSIVSG